jgi:hypothetical protein
MAGSGRMTGKPEIMPDCGIDVGRIRGNIRFADNTGITPFVWAEFSYRERPFDPFGDVEAV